MSFSSRQRFIKRKDHLPWGSASDCRQNIQEPPVEETLSRRPAPTTRVEMYPRPDSDQVQIRKIVLCRRCNNLATKIFGLSEGQLLALFNQQGSSRLWKHKDSSKCCVSPAQQLDSKAFKEAPGLRTTTEDHHWRDPRPFNQWKKRINFASVLNV